MIWISLTLLSILAMLPLGLSIGRGTRAKDWPDAALSLRRAQLAELDLDLADGRIGVSEHANASLEVQRRLLAGADEREDGPITSGKKSPLMAALAVLPAIAVLLYLADGSPGMPSVPPDAIVAEPMAMPASNGQRSAETVPGAEGDALRSGHIGRGKDDAGRGNMQAAAAEWQAALAIRFDPALAVVTAEALTEAAGHVTDAAAVLFRRALAGAPAHASWRAMVEKRLSEAAIRSGTDCDAAIAGN
jgi:cytochrome c-type biogenesis protein CcmH